MLSKPFIDSCIAFIKNNPGIAGAIISSVTGIITFALGLYVGNKLALGRARRSEFNEAALPIAQALHRQLDNVSHGKYAPDVISHSDFINFSVFIRRKKKRTEYFQDVKRYEACFTPRILPGINGARAQHSKFADDLPELKQATLKLLRHLELK